MPHPQPEIAIECVESGGYSDIMIGVDIYVAPTMVGWNEENDQLRGYEGDTEDDPVWTEETIPEV